MILLHSVSGLDVQVMFNKKRINCQPLSPATSHSEHAQLLAETFFAVFAMVISTARFLVSSRPKFKAKFQQFGYGSKLLILQIDGFPY